MAWIQLTLVTDKTGNEQAEEALLEAGALSVTLKDAEDDPVLEPAPGETPLWNKIIITGLFEADTDIDLVTQHIHQHLGTEVHLRIEPLEEKDWVRAWMDNYKPMQFGNRLWVCPKHLQPPQPDAVNLMLDPGLAFGTGTHPTTSLCLQWLNNIALENQTVLDYGCGSGVLGIAALLLNAKHCDAVDIDPQALEATIENARANGVINQIKVMLPEQLKQQNYDIVIANILAGPLTKLAEQLSQKTKTGGHIVLSGILEHQAKDILNAYQKWFILDPVVTENEWIRITGTKK
ncbi:MAG: 50S ribosomal protein L11 methyltransferase [Gammaproteobacteria bacterium]|nr:50S ribosomal protein L11 methyltransferase [Gammaproteobacteria bacterium]